MQLEFRIPRQLLGEHRDQLVLLALQPIGIRRDVGEHAEVELGNHAFVTAAKLPLRADDPKFVQPVGNAAWREHLHSRRMKCRGTRIFVRFRAAFQHSDRHSGRNEEQGRGQSGRSASNNDDAGVTHETA